MKKISIGLAALFSLFLFNAQAATVAPKNEASIPCYNSGYSFGLAGYSTQLPASLSESENPNDTASEETGDDFEVGITDYR